MRTILVTVAAALAFSSLSLGLASCACVVVVDPELPVEEREAAESEILLSTERRLSLLASRDRRNNSVDLQGSQRLLKLRPLLPCTSSGHRLTPSVMAPLLT